jgi:hypothetical protein
MAEAVVAWAEKIIRTPDKPGRPLFQEPHAIYRAGKAKRPKTNKFK